MGHRSRGGGDSQACVLSRISRVFVCFVNVFVLGVGGRFVADVTNPGPKALPSSVLCAFPSGIVIIIGIRFIMYHAYTYAYIHVHIYLHTHTQTAFMHTCIPRAFVRVCVPDDLGGGREGDDPELGERRETFNGFLCRWV